MPGENPGGGSGATKPSDHITPKPRKPKKPNLQKRVPVQRPERV